MTHLSLPFGLFGKNDAVQSGFSTDPLTAFAPPLTPNDILRLVLFRTNIWFRYYDSLVSHLFFRSSGKRMMRMPPRRPSFGLLGKKEVLVPAW